MFVGRMRIDGIRQIIDQKMEYVMVPMKIKDLEKAMVSIFNT
jgi:hypothetical protein